MNRLTRLLLRLLKITGIAVASILLVLFLAPYLFPDRVGRQIRQWTNQSIRGELNFSKARLSFFTHFPSLTLTLYDVDLKGSAPFQQDTLLAAEKLGFGVNLEKLIFGHQVSINKIYLNTAFIHVLINDSGQANYDIYKSDTSVARSGSSDSSASLHLEKIIIKDSRLVYNDLSIPMQIQAEHLFYEGTGDLSKSVFDLASHIQTDSLNFTFNNQSYVRRKAIDANLITRINTKTLALVFQNNQIRMNKINLAFTGNLDFLKNGYDMDFKLTTDHADLYQLITIFPPEYLAWLQKTTVKGTVDLSCELKGKYIASSGEMPDFGIHLAVHDGYISYQDAKLPLSRLNIHSSAELPELDQEKLHVKIDTLSFHMDQDFFQGEIESTGISEPRVHAKANASMDLQNLKKALGISSFDMQGQLKMQLAADGKYAKKIVKISLRKKDTVIASIPVFDLQGSLKNGYIKYNAVTQPVQNIFVILHAACPDADYRHAYFKIDSLHAAALKDFVEGRAIVHASQDFPMDVNLKGLLDLSDIKQVYPLDSLTLSGLVRFNILASGKYAPQHHLFPKANAHFSMLNGWIQTKYYPHPIEKINLEIDALDNNGNLNGLNLSVKPAALQFEGRPFQFQGSFKNFDDLIYDLSVNGEIDLGRIYQVFARKDIGVSGMIRAHASFRGRQSDATNGRYDLLRNSGTMELKNLTVTQDMFPKPFFIQEGNFRFDQDKMWFDQFRAKYGRSDLQMNGFAENVINYVLSSNQTLKASFDLKAKQIDLNEFTVYSPPVQTETESATGVILVPATLDLTINATADQVIYNDISLNQFHGGINIRNSEIEMTETGFELIGCQVEMKGKYASISPLKARFEYQLQAKDFDVQKAYKEIKIFHDLASSAAHASGIISINYSLSGKLNERMYPVYPSLAGGGVLSVKKVKFNGWKLFNTVSSQSGKSELTDPDLSKIDVKSTIKNNLITIEKLKFKTGGMRIRFEGQTSFDNKVNFKMRIGLPPLGIIGIPVRVTGSSDNPKIRMGKSDTDPLQEKTDDSN